MSKTPFKSSKDPPSVFVFIFFGHLSNRRCLETVAPAKSSDVNKFAAAMHLWYVIVTNVCEKYPLDQVLSE
jgi:hypothetical protein